MNHWCRIVNWAHRNKCQWNFPQKAKIWIPQSSFENDGDHVVPDTMHDDVIRWKHFPRYWPFVQGIHRSLVNSPHKGQWRGVLMISLISAWTNDWENNWDAGDLRRHRAHYDVIVMLLIYNICAVYWVPLMILMVLTDVWYKSQVVLYITNDETPNWWSFYYLIRDVISFINHWGWQVYS